MTLHFNEGGGRFLYDRSYPDSNKTFKLENLTKTFIKWGATVLGVIKQFKQAGLY